ncbi:hypothetical protein N7504_007257 [Penicillium tannophilum]|nr:hypothetical protein N7504_007257 [Penicillium tannophilum]
MPSTFKKKAPAAEPTLPTDTQSFIQHVQTMHAKAQDYIAMERLKHMEEPSVATSSGSAPTSKKPHIAMFTWKNYGITHFDVNAAWNHVDNRPQMSLENVRLDDQGIFWAIAAFGPKERYRRFSYDFDSHGDPRPFRVPKDPPMVIWAHGLPWFPVFKDVYMLAGSWSTATGYMLQTRVPRNGTKTRISDTMSLGFVLAPPAAVEASKAFSSMILELRTRSSVSYDPDTTKGIIDVGALTGRLIVHMRTDLPVIAIGSKIKATCVPLLSIQGFQPSVAPGESPTFSGQDFASQGFQNTAGETFANVATQIGTPDPQDSSHHTNSRDVTTSGTDEDSDEERRAYIKDKLSRPKSPRSKSPRAMSPRFKSPRRRSSGRRSSRRRSTRSKSPRPATADKPLTRLGWWIVKQEYSSEDMELIRSRVSRPATNIDFLVSILRDGDSDEVLRALSLSSELQVTAGLINDSSQFPSIKDAMSRHYSALTADLIGVSTEELVQRP